METGLGGEAWAVGMLCRGEEWCQVPVCLEIEQEVGWTEETTTPLMTAVRAATSAAWCWPDPWCDCSSPVPAFSVPHVLLFL